MIRFSAGLVVVAIGVLIGGVATSKLSLVYLAIVVSAAALVALAIGVALKRGEIFGEAPQERGPAPAAASPADLPVVVGAGASLDRTTQERTAGSAFGKDSQRPADLAPFQPAQSGRPSAPRNPPPAPWAVGDRANSPGRDEDTQPASGWQAPSPGASAGGWQAAAASPSGAGRWQAPGPDDAGAAPAARRGGWENQDTAGPAAGRPPVPGRRSGPGAVGFPSGPAAAPSAPAARFAGSAAGPGGPAGPGRPPGAGGPAGLGRPPGAGGPAGSRDPAGSAGPAGSRDPAGSAGPAGSRGPWAAGGEPPVTRPWRDHPGPSFTPAGPAGGASSAEAGGRGSGGRAGSVTPGWFDRRAEQAVNTPDTASAAADTATVATPVDDTATEGPAKDTATEGLPTGRSAAAPEPENSAFSSTAPAGQGSAGERAARSDPDSTAADARDSGDDIPDDSDVSRPADETGSGGDSPEAEPTGTRRVAVIPGVPRYHEPDCILIRFMSGEGVQRLTVPEAKEAGCTPCAACQPED